MLQETLEAGTGVQMAFCPVAEDLTDAPASRLDRLFLDEPDRGASEPGVAPKQLRVLAVCSGGGHWIQMRRLWKAFSGYEIAMVTTDPVYQRESEAKRFYAVPDANMDTKRRLVMLAARVAWVLLRERPHVIVSTGAAPGYFAIRLGKLLGAKTVWVDSIANVEKLSLCGRKVGRHADLWLTQWPHLARPEGPHFAGAVV